MNAGHMETAERLFEKAKQLICWGEERKLSLRTRIGLNSTTRIFVSIGPDEQEEELTNGIEIDITDIVNKAVHGLLTEDKAALVVSRRIFENNDGQPCGVKVDRDYVMENCYTRVLPADRNVAILSECPYEWMCDLVETVIVKISSGDENGYINVDSQMLEVMGIQKDELFKAARKHMEEHAVFRPLDEVIKEMSCGTYEKPEGEEQLLYVLTNDECLFGAAMIRCPDVLKKCASEMGTDVFIIPCSVHEVLLLKKVKEYDIRSIANVIMEVNQTEVADEDFLSNSLYGMNEDGTVYIAS